jgi:cobalt ECF transporter T component CbiQ
MIGIAREIEYALYAEELAKKAGLLQSLDARVKVAGFFALIINVALARNISVIGGIFLLAIILALLSRVPLMLLAKRAWLAALLFTGLIALPAIFLTPGQTIFQISALKLTISAPGLRSALFLIMRAETAVTLSFLLIFCTLWTHILKALAALGVPVVIIVILSITYRYIFLMFQTALNMFEARQSRMIGELDGAEKRRVAAASVGVLLGKTFQLSNEVFLAMQARGFRGDVQILDEFHMQPRDWLALIGFACLTALAGWLRLRLS